MARSESGTPDDRERVASRVVHLREDESLSVGSRDEHESPLPVLPTGEAEADTEDRQVIVVDVGCHPQPPEESVYKLARRFAPDILFGFDPFPDLREGIEVWSDVLIVRRRLAAATHDGHVLFSVDGIESTSTPSIMTQKPEPVPCFDFAPWLRTLPPGELVVKFDAEGVEYPILDRLHMSGLDERISLLLVEFHDEVETLPGWPAGAPGKVELLGRLRCPVEVWS